MQRRSKDTYLPGSTRAEVSSICSTGIPARRPVSACQCCSITCVVVLTRLSIVGLLALGLCCHFDSTLHRLWIWYRASMKRTIDVEGQVLISVPEVVLIGGIFPLYPC